MSGLNLDITYNDVINTIFNWMFVNCKNVNTIDSLPDCYKSDYSQFYDTEGTGQGDSAYRPGFYISTSNYVSKVVSGTVKNKIIQFFTNTCNLPDVNLTVYDSQFLDLMFDIMILITNYCVFVTSPFSETNTPQKSAGSILLPLTKSSRYLIFNNTSSLTITGVRDLSGASNPSSEKKILASDFNAMFDILFSYINKNIKVKPIKYSVSFNG